MVEPLILALWGAVSVFVLWLALVSVVRKRMAASTPAVAMAAEVPEPTAEELHQARSLGLYVPDDPPRN